MTSISVLIVLFVLLFFGGDTMARFALAIILGVFVGTYSSIYVASALALWLGVSRKDLLPTKKESAEGSRP